MSDDEATPDLLPCPFCGANAPNVYLCYPGGWDERYRAYVPYVLCAPCGNRSATTAGEAAIAAWNRRTPDPELASLRDRLARAEAERDAVIALCVKYRPVDSSERHIWWHLVGITGQADPVNQVRVAAGLPPLEDR